MLNHHIQVFEWQNTKYFPILFQFKFKAFVRNTHLGVIQRKEHKSTPLPISRNTKHKNVLSETFGDLPNYKQKSSWVLFSS